MADPPNLNQNRKDIMDIAAMTEETFRSVAANIQEMFANALDASDTVVRSFQKDISNSIKNVARESSKLADNFENSLLDLIVDDRFLEIDFLSILLLIFGRPYQFPYLQIHQMQVLSDGYLNHLHRWSW